MFHLAPAELFIIMSIVFLIFGILLIPKIFYCLTLQKCLTRCSPQCRTLVPGQVWLLLIPLFDLVWHFIVVTRVSVGSTPELVER